MRKWLKFVLLGCLGLVLASCSKDDDEVTVIVAPEITGFEVTLASGSGSEVFKAVIDGMTINLTVPAGTDVTALKPSIRTNEGTTTHPASGEAVNLANPKIYKAINEYTVLEYIVTVIVAPEPTE